MNELLHPCAQYLEARRAPDGGWPLEIDPPPSGKSSIVNTAEALLVLSAAGVSLQPDDPAVQFLLTALDDHPPERGDVTRFISFGILGLRACAVPLTNSRLVRAIDRLVSRYSETRGGWGERVEDPPSLFSTYYALTALRAANFSTEDINAKFGSAIQRARTLLNDHNDCVPLNSRVGGSLSGTAYATLTFCYSSDPEIATDLTRIAASLRDQIVRAVRSNRQVDVEPQPNTSWHHYCVCLGLRALLRIGERSWHSPHNLRQAALATASILNTADPSSGIFLENRADIGSATVNVRSIYNSAVALADAGRYLSVDKFAAPPEVLRSLSTESLAQIPGPIPPVAGVATLSDEKRMHLYGAAVARHLGVRAAEACRPAVGVRILRCLEGGLSGAYVDLCELEVDNRREISVFKLSESKEPGLSEASQTRLAGYLSHGATPRVDDLSAHTDGLELMKLDFAGAPWNPSSCCTVRQLVLSDFAGAGIDPRDVLRPVLFDQLAPFHGSIRRETRSVAAAMREFMELRGGANFVQELDSGLFYLMRLGFVETGDTSRMICFPWASAAVPGTWFISALGRATFLVDTVIASRIHGDLNARNILCYRQDIGSDWHSTVIDFASVRNSANSAIDYARLEADIVSCWVEQKASALWRNDAFALRLLDETLFGRVSQIGSPGGEILGILELELGTDAASLAFRRAISSVRAAHVSERKTSSLAAPPAYGLIVGLMLVMYVKPRYSSRFPPLAQAALYYLGMRILERFTATVDLVS